MMLAMLRSDLYRAWHRGDAFWTLMLCFVGVTVVGLASLWYLTTQSYADLAASMGSTATAQSLGLATLSAAPTYLVGQSLVAGGGLGMVSALLTMYVVSNDLKSGFVRTVVGSLGGRAAYYAEKILLAAVNSAIAVAVGVVVTVSGLLLVGFRFTADDPASFVVGWIVLVWLTCWANSVLVCLLTWASRSRTVGWLATLGLMGPIQQVLMGLVSLTRSDAAANAVAEFCSWLPYGNFVLLAGGTGHDGYVAGATLGLDAPALARIALCGAGVVVVAGALALVSQRHRDVA